MSIVKELHDGTPYIKAKYMEEDQVLKGIWHVYIKLDGVRILRDDAGNVLSRNSKPLYNVEHLEFQDAEFYHKNWNVSVSIVRTESFIQTDQSMVYELTDHKVDPRLLIGRMLNPTWPRLEVLMKQQLELGNEGLVIRQFNARKGRYDWLKVVPKKQADVRIIAFKEGKGRLAGTLGSIETNWGSVGSGFDDNLRKYIWENRKYWVGTIIQVEYREVTENGKLRFPAFIKHRPDKDEEDVQIGQDT